MLKQKSFIRYLKLLWICVYECRVGIRKRRDGGTNNIFAQIMVAQELKITYAVEYDVKLLGVDAEDITSALNKSLIDVSNIKLEKEDNLNMTADVSDLYLSSVNSMLKVEGMASKK